MIAPQELRLGNYVEYKGYIYQVWSIGNNSNPRRESYFIDLDSSTIDNHLKGVDSNDVFPIELSEYWLLKFGFDKKSEHNLELHALTRSIIHAYSHGKVEIELGNRTGYSFGYPAVQYVHQLQNLFHSLCGEELKIKE